MTSAVEGMLAGLGRAAYTLVGISLMPFLALHLMWRGLRQPAYLAHWSERFLGAAVRPSGHTAWARAFEHHASSQLLWVHAVSVGETRAAAPLIHAWLAKSGEHRVVLTHTTPTGRETGRSLFASLITADPPRLMQRYLPYDFPWANALFLSWARPHLGVLMETELWPNLLAQAKARGIPLALVNARLSPRSAKRMLRFRLLARPALASLAGIAAQTPADAQGFQDVLKTNPGWLSPSISVVGNMKFDVHVPAEMREQGGRWRAALAGRVVWLAASTREDEEGPLLQAWNHAQSSGRLSAADVLVIVPRHPQRFDRVARWVQESGLTLSRRSQWPAAADAPLDAASAGVQVILGDSLGEMFAYMEMADLVLIGGSIPNLGGQNPIEACAMGRPVFFGPNMFNFHQIARALQACGAGSEVASPEDWIHQGIALLGDAPAYAHRSGAALTFAQTHRGATQRTEAFLAGLGQ